MSGLKNFSIARSKNDSEIFVQNRYFCCLLQTPSSTQIEDLEPDPWTPDPGPDQAPAVSQPVTDASQLSTLILLSITGFI
jgi:hypothetical protein